MTSRATVRIACLVLAVSCAFAPAPALAQSGAFAPEDSRAVTIIDEHRAEILRLLEPLRLQETEILAELEELRRRDDYDTSLEERLLQQLEEVRRQIASLERQLATLNSLRGPASRQSIAEVDLSSRLNEVIAAVGQLQGEIAKETQADRSVAEAIATYEIQEILRREAAENRDILERRQNACMDTATADAITDAEHAAQTYSGRRTNDVLNDAMSDERPQIRRAGERHDRALEQFCSQVDEEHGRCTVEAADVEAGDMLSLSLLSSSAGGEGFTETYSGAQLPAAEAFSERIIGMDSLPPPLTMQCDTPQCMAYEELRKRHFAMTSGALHSLNSIMARRSSPIDVLNTNEETEAD